MPCDGNLQGKYYKLHPLDLYDQLLASLLKELERKMYMSGHQPEFFYKKLASESVNVDTQELKIEYSNIYKISAVESLIY